ncbi:unnamed protein product [Alopecurus aequalis]
MAMAPRALALLLLALMTALPPATSDARVQVAKGGGYMFMECHQAAPLSASNASDADAFRTDLHALLFDLPTATDPTGFASLHSDNGPFVRGLCFDDVSQSQPSSRCAECLTAAAEKSAHECGGSRRAGVWSAGCFVAYADSNVSSPQEDAYRGREFSNDTDCAAQSAFYDAHELAALALSLAPRAANSSSGPMMATTGMTTGGKGTVHAVARCPRDVTKASCAGCLEKSARELLDTDWGIDGRHEGVAVVAGFNCHLRLEIHAPDLTFGKLLLVWMKECLPLFVFICVMVALLIAVVLYGCIMMVVLARECRNA